MRVFVAGATGTIGQRLIPMLVEAGHQVTGTTRSPGRVERIRAAGAIPVMVDALDAAAVRKAVGWSAPEVVVHELTAIPANLDLRHFGRDFAMTNRLRTEGVDYLIAAAREAGCRRFVAQSFAGWPYARNGGPVKSEEDPLDPEPPAGLRSALEAIRYVEQRTTAIPEISGVVLRYGAFYGPGNMIGAGGSLLEQVRKRLVPVVGRGTGIWSFVHIDDAARATVQAVERGAPGIYNIVDDEPAPVAEWLPTLAAAIGAQPPRRLPAWLARLAIGQHGVVMMTEVRGASNAKAKRELNWRPAWPSWREGFKSGLDESHSARQGVEART
jgi:nucleoside-diphosphate-sugar epimerase